MSDDSEFGPWVLHDGKGCPCVGEYTHCEYDDGDEAEGIAALGGSWLWTNPEIWGFIIRYRIRRPKGMAILNAILADLPAPVKTDGVIA